MEHASLLGLRGVSSKSGTSPGQTGGWTTLSHVSCTCPFVCRACRALRQETMGAARSAPVAAPSEHVRHKGVELFVLSHVQLYATLRTAACQAPLSVGFSGQGYCSGLPCPSPHKGVRDKQI